MLMTASVAVHASALVIDCHADTPQRFLDEGWNFSDALGEGMICLEDAWRGGLNAEFFAIWAEPVEWRGRYAQRSLALIEATLAQIRKHPETMRLGLSAEDITRAHEDGVFCALMGLEGGHSIENDLGLLQRYYELGVRYMTLTWANTNEWADSSGDLDDANVVHHNGLTNFGRNVVREMNRLGMMVDLSHVSDATFWDVLRTTHAPVLVSHSGARAVTDSARNLTDEMLRAVATSNGVVMVPFYASFLDDGWRMAWDETDGERTGLYEAAARPYRERGEPVPYGVPLAVDREFYASVFSKQRTLPGIEVLIEHFDHVARVAGIDHVGIGSDFDGFAMSPMGMETAADLPKITAGLMERGYTAEQMQKILGKNLLRVFGDVAAKARRE